MLYKIEYPLKGHLHSEGLPTTALQSPPFWSDVERVIVEVRYLQMLG